MFPEQLSEQLKPQDSGNDPTDSNSMPHNALMSSPTSLEAVSETTVKSSSSLSSSGSFSSSENKILKANTKHYTIQILALHDRKKLKLISEKAELKGKVHFCRSEFKGKPWYMLVYGDYSTREEAQQAIKELPQDIQKEKPWYVSFLSLQKAIHDRK